MSSLRILGKAFIKSDLASLLMTLTSGARVSAYVRCGDLALAERALRSGRSDKPGARPGVYAYTALVQGLSRGGRLEEARGWLDTMKEDGRASH